MEWLLGFVLGWSLFGNKESSESSKFVKLDDKNYIINNEFVSFEEDTELLRMQQEQEDNKHYRNYERRKLKDDMEMSYNQWEAIIEEINKDPELLKSVTEKDLLKNKNEYSSYIEKCNKLNTWSKLTEEEFSVIGKLPSYIPFKWCKINVRNPMYGGYVIYNEKTAKYADGDMHEMIAKEFEKKWY